MRPLRVAVSRDFPPYSFVDEQGAPAGFVVDLFRAIAEHEAIGYEFVPTDSLEADKGIRAGELDAVVGLVRTSEREEWLDFSIPVLDLGHYLFVREDSSIETLSDLDGQTVAVPSLTIWDHVLLRELPGINRRSVDGVTEALRLVDEGSVQAAFALIDQGLYMKRQHVFKNIRSVGQPLRHYSYRFGVVAGRSDILAELNDGLHWARRSGTYDQLWDEWLGVLKEEDPWRSPWVRLLIAALGSAALLLLLSVLWSASLRRRVEVRTRELRTSEQDRLGLQARLLQSQKLEALGRMATGIAHDFNNLLTVIIGSASAVRDEPRDAAAVEQALGQITKAGSAGAQLTGQLLGFARRQAVEPRPIDWNHVVKDSEGMLGSLTGAGTRLVIELAPDIPPVCLDPGQALQILMNLVINASDAGADEIRIETAQVDEQGHIFGRLSVFDDGRGIDPECQEQIFEPFFTSKGRGRGTGLGLATVHGIVEQNEGRIDVKSALGEGSVFHVVLPAALEADEERIPIVATPFDRSVLVVDDEPDVQELAALLLRSLGYDVTVVGDAEAAVELLKEGLQPGTLLTEVDLPGMSGAELARWTLAIVPSVRVLFTAAYPGKLDLPRGTRAGFVTKPFTRETLARAFEDNAERS